MSFFKFRLDDPPERSTPVPIAAAVPQTSPRWQHSHVFPRPPAEFVSQELSVEEACSTPSAIHAVNNVEVAGILDIDVPRTGSKARGRKSIALKNRRKKVACTECQISKTRCENPLSGLKNKCRRCLRLNKECIVCPSVRLPSVKDSAKQCNSLPTTGDLLLSHGPSSYHPQEHGKEGFVNASSDLETEISASFSEGLIKANQRQLSEPLPESQRIQIDSKINSILTMRTAEEVFDQYISNFAPKCPIVVFPPEATAAIVRKNKPLLFLSILSIASAGYCTVAKQRELAIEVKNQLADRAIVRGEKSLELIQAFQVMSLWYRAPDEYRQMNLGQLVHITTTMAIDLGLDKIDVLKPAATAQENRGRVELQRAWLGCFILVASFSLILRRPNLIIWTAKVDDYLADLQLTKAEVTDEFLCRLVATERLCHDINQELFLSDPARSLSRQDPKTMLIIQGFQDRNDSLSLVQLQSLQKAIVQFGKFASSLYAHELALHVNNNIDEFQAPFFAKSLKTCKLVGVQDSNASHLSMLRIIVIASQGLLDTFIGLSVSDMLALPPHIYGGRVIYAVVLLMKIHKTVTESGKETNNSIPLEELHLDTYLEQLVAISKRLIAKDERSALSRAFLIMPQLMGWFYRYWSRRPSGADGSTMTEDLLTNNSNGQGSSASQAPTGTFGRSPNAIQTLGHIAPLENVVSPGGPGHQFDQLIQHSVLPSPPMYSRENSHEARGLSVTPDNWFAEFFNVEMLG